MISFLSLSLFPSLYRSPSCHSRWSPNLSLAFHQLSTPLPLCDNNCIHSSQYCFLVFTFRCCFVLLLWYSLSYYIFFLNLSLSVNAYRFVSLPFSLALSSSLLLFHYLHPSQCFSLRSIKLCSIILSTSLLLLLFYLILYPYLPLSVCCPSLSVCLWLSVCIFVRLPLFVFLSDSLSLFLFLSHPSPLPPAKPANQPALLPCYAPQIVALHYVVDLSGSNCILSFTLASGRGNSQGDLVRTEMNRW